MAYQIKTANFEGPFDVLLNLIEKRKLFINEISLASITDDYIGYVKTIDKRDIGAYASFISIAATLILIKSRSLIPNLTLTTEEEEDIGNLERRLELYKLIKEIGQDIEEQFGKKIIFPRLENKIELKVFAPDPQITKDSMFAGILSVVQAIPEVAPEKPEVIISKVKSLEETINDLLERVKSSIKMTFKSFSSTLGYKEGKEQKVGVIVSFIAMLELVRQGIIEANQGDDFDDIHMESIKQEETNI